MARGIHPAILARGGLEPALKTLRAPLHGSVELDARGVARLPERVEVAAYYVVAETLTNAAKHAHASVVSRRREAADHTLGLRVRDDGSGGADPGRGTGLAGSRPRRGARRHDHRAQPGRRGHILARRVSRSPTDRRRTRDQPSSMESLISSVVPAPTGLATSIVPPKRVNAVGEADESGTTGRIGPAAAIVADRKPEDSVPRFDGDMHRGGVRRASRYW